MIDKAILNLLTILMTGSGLFAVLTKFKVPELNMMFLGENPYAVKRDIIDSTMTWVFTSLVLIGLLIQVFREILGQSMPERLYTTKFYLLFFAACFVLMSLSLFLLAGLGNWIAKKSWLPAIIESQKEIFHSSLFIVEHDGWREDQLHIKDKLANPEQYRVTNLKTAEERISQIEKLLDLVKTSDDLHARTQQLKPFFR